MQKIFGFFIGIFLFAQFDASAFLMTSDDQNVCYFIESPTNLQAVFEIGAYTCADGYYLPQNQEGCVPCPTGHNCNHGEQTYTFNENKSQGIIYNSFLTDDMDYGCDELLLFPKNGTTNIHAVFEPVSRECSAGYYLPKNVDECTECLNDSWCPGGTYTFSETEDKGKNPCPDAHPFAPRGMWLESQCGRKFHVANGVYHDVLYLHQQPANPTEHKFKILYSGNDTPYFVNAVLRDMTPGAAFPKMSAAAGHGFHAMIKDTVNGVEVEREYLFCDDSVPECRNNQ